MNKAAKYLWKRRKPTHSPYREQEFLHWPNGQPPLLPGSVVRCNDPYMYKTYQEISDHCNQAVLKYLEEDKEK